MDELIAKWDDWPLTPVMVSFRDGNFNAMDSQHWIAAMQKVDSFTVGFAYFSSQWSSHSPTVIGSAVCEVLEGIQMTFPGCHAVRASINALMDNRGALMSLCC